MNLKAPTVKQHLDILSGADLVEQVESGRKWKYYSLTRKGKQIFVKQESTNILIVVAVSSIALLAVCYSFVGVFYMASVGPPALDGGGAAPPASITGGEEDKDVMPAGEIGGSTAEQDFAAHAVAIAMLAALIVYMAARMQKLKARMG